MKPIYAVAKKSNKIVEAGDVVSGKLDRPEEGVYQLLQNNPKGLGVSEIERVLALGKGAVGRLVGRLRRGQRVIFKGEVWKIKKKNL